MYRVVFTVVLSTLLASSTDGQSTTPPPVTEVLPTFPGITCNEEKVGYTYSVGNPLYYYICHDENTPIVLHCVDGTGYINNGYLEGCVPWTLWQCTSKADMPVCTSNLSGQVFPSPTPNVYWSCSGNSQPSVITCPDGQAFVPSLGSCQAWSVWLQTCPY